MFLNYSVLKQRLQVYVHSIMSFPGGRECLGARLAPAIVLRRDIQHRSYIDRPHMKSGPDEFEIIPRELPRMENP